MKLWKSTTNQLLQWLKIATDNVGLCITQRETEAQQLLFTDASDTGFACVLFEKNTFSVRSDRWSNTRFWKDLEFLPSINHRELYAVVQAVEWLKEQNIPLNKVRLFIDNTSALSALQRGYSKSFWLNELITLGALDAGFAQGSFFFDIQYVKSEENLADIYTRDLLGANFVGSQIATTASRTTTSLLQVEHSGAFSLAPPDVSTMMYPV